MHAYERMKASMPNDDKVYEAYVGLRGEQMEKLIRERIDWILSEAIGPSILDIGCSQGIISLLLGKKFSKVDGIDIQPEAIEFARELQKSKYPETQENVRFHCKDFLQFHSSCLYDCAIITEVVEHLDDPETFLQHTKELLNENGRVILSVPFSLNRHPDHKNTYYISNFYELVAPFFHIEKILFIEQWIGMVAKKSKEKNPTIADVAKKFLCEEESQFLRVHTALQDRNDTLYKQAQTVNEKAKQFRNNYEKCKEWLAQRNHELERQREQHSKLIQQLNETHEKMLAYQKNYETSKQWLANRTRELENCQKLLKDREQELEQEKENAASYQGLAQQLSACITENDASAQLLIKAKKEIQQLQAQNTYLKTENNNYARKFAKITSTWYGKFALNWYHRLQKSKWKLQALARKIKGRR